jgi:3-hydroxyacyl-CoA dehydrogenase
LSIAVIGAGLMDHGFAQVLAQSSHAVALTDTAPRCAARRSRASLATSKNPVCLQPGDAETVRRRLAAHLLASARSRA